MSLQPHHCFATVAITEKREVVKANSLIFLQKKALLFLVADAIRIYYILAKMVYQEEKRESFKCETIRRIAELAAFMAKWMNLPAQRTKGWYDDRMFSIGASEVAALFGIDPYKTIRTLIGSKVGLIPFGDKRAVNWGNVLEKVITLLAEVVFDCHIEEMGSIPTAGMRNQRSSPDGVAVVPCLGNKIISFEFKAPKSRIPNGKIPRQYLPQVLTCLCAVEPADLGIFMDVALRRCSIVDWHFDSLDYCYRYHRNVALDEPTAITMVYFYKVPGSTRELPEVEFTAIADIADLLANINVSGPIDPDEQKVEDFLNIADNEAKSAKNAKSAAMAPRFGNGAINLGECAPELLDEYLAHTCDHNLVAKYGRIIVPGEDVAVSVEIAKCEPNCLAILPLKVMRCVTVPVSKDPEYAKQLQPVIDKIIPVIEKIMQVPEQSRQSVYERECDANGWKEVPRVWGGKK